MSIFYFPLISKGYIRLRELSAKRGISFGMAGEYTSFDSSVQAPLIKRHASIFTTEVSMKMEYTQPMRGVYAFDYADAMIAKCQEYAIDVHGHCIMWHAQNPDWLWGTLAGINIDARYQVLHNHIKALVEHYSGNCVSMDVVNEYGTINELDGWGYYLGRDCVKYAFETARQYAGNMKLYYNSYFPNDVDADLAIELLPYTDGIGVQLHLNTWRDYTDLFARVRRMAEACKQNGKTMRFSEVSVQQSEGYSLDEVAEVYRRTVRLALEYPGVITNYTQWGVKGVAWNGGLLPFDSKGLPIEPIYDAIVREVR